MSKRIAPNPTANARNARNERPTPWLEQHPTRGLIRGVPQEAPPQSVAPLYPHPRKFPAPEESTTPPAPYPPPNSASRKSPHHEFRRRAPAPPERRLSRAPRTPPDR